MSDHSELKRLAEAASPGPWLQENDDLYFKDDGYTRHMMTTDAGHDVCDEDDNDDWHRDNLKFIAAANPAAVLALIAENEALRKGRTDWQAECLKRGFEYVRESDDHYVLADLPEMADLLGMLLGVEVRTKDNDAYEEANSRLNEQVEGLINTIHKQESMRKDAERWRFVRNPTATGSPFAIWSERTNLFLGKFADEAIDAAMSKEG